MPRNRFVGRDGEPIQLAPLALEPFFEFYGCIDVEPGQKLATVEHRGRVEFAELDESPKLDRVAAKLGLIDG
ncbi:MAG TPA: hypothetical protein VKP00_06475, partial [Gemmatimonadaceae bacterium]|nr:hypothetical protein [Gemmatimonadaceae bacterium]